MDQPPNTVASAAASILRIHLLGGFRIVVGGRAIDAASWRARHAAALIKLLAVAPGHRLGREQLSATLWPEHDPDSAAANLRQVLRGARRALEPTRPAGTPATFLRQEGAILVLAEPGAAWVDVAAFEAAAAHARRSHDPADYRVALDLYTGDLLADDRYADWADALREALRSTRLALLLELGRLEAAGGGLDAAAEALRAVLTAEPAHEDAHAGLMRLYARQGQPAQAQRQYQALTDALRREVDAVPSAASRALAEAIRAGRIPPDATPVAPATPPGAPADPPTPVPARHNLPAALTAFIGRAPDLAAVRALLGDHRLVTLTGVGGTGKTRLALAVAEQAREDYPEGVWLVELASLADPGLVPRGVAAALAVRERPGAPLLAALVDALADDHRLLLLDNCEHLIDACAHLAEGLLTHCPHLRILATSREPLGIPGEAVYRVPALALPASATAASAAALAEADAVQFFVARARAAQPGFILTDANAALVARVCARLDGIPLALELAAARLRALALEQLAERLDDRFRLLAGGSRTALPRQQTLQATLDWSYRLLSDDERTVFRRLAVFAGGWTLAAAETICAGAPLADWAVLDLLAGLVDKSLVLLDGDGESARYRLLETVRQYAGERLAETDEGATVRDRHAGWCLALAEEAAPRLATREQAHWLARLDAETDNLRAALAWCRSGVAATGLRLSVALAHFWLYVARLDEGVEWLGRFLALAREPTLHRAWALVRLGELLNLAFPDLARIEAVSREATSLSRALGAREPLLAALQLLRAILLTRHGPQGRGGTDAETLALCRELGDRLSEGKVLQAMGTDAYLGGDLERARTLLATSRAIFREVGDSTWTTIALGRQARMAWWAGEYGQVLRIAEEMRDLGRAANQEWMAFAAAQQRCDAAWASGDLALARSEGEWGVAWVDRQGALPWSWSPGMRISLARAALAAHDLARARVLLEEALPRAREELVGETHVWLGRAAWQAGESVAALEHLRAALRRQHERGEWVYAPNTLEILAGVLRGDGKDVPATRLLAAADAARTVLGLPRPPVEQPVVTETRSVARAALDDATFAGVWSSGVALALHEAVAEALVLLAGPVVDAGRPER